MPRLCRCLSSPDAARVQLAERYWSSVNYYGYVVGLALYCVLAAIVVWVVGQLWLLHMVLVYKQLSTLQYIQLNKASYTAVAASPPPGLQHTRSRSSSGSSMNRPGPGLLENSSSGGPGWLRSPRAVAKVLGFRDSRVGDAQLLQQQQLAQQQLTTSRAACSQASPKKARVSLSPCVACRTLQPGEHISLSLVHGATGGSLYAVPGSRHAAMTSHNERHNAQTLPTHATDSLLLAAGIVKSLSSTKADIAAGEAVAAAAYEGSTPHAMLMLQPAPATLTGASWQLANYSGDGNSVHTHSSVAVLPPDDAREFGGGELVLSVTGLAAFETAVGNGARRDSADAVPESGRDV
jgi:hypothetical protein